MPTISTLHALCVRKASTVHQVIQDIQKQPLALIVQKESFLGRRVSSQVQGAIHVSLESIQIPLGSPPVQVANHVL
jgi:hypothetical protein